MRRSIPGIDRSLTYYGQGGIVQLCAIQSEIPYLSMEKSAALHRHEAVARAASGEIRTILLIAEYAVPVQLAGHHACFRPGQALQPSKESGFHNGLGVGAE